MKFTEILNKINSPIAFYTDLVPLVGSHEAAMFLSQLTYWTGKQHDPDGWIHKTQEEWFDETFLTKKQQRCARDKLVKRGYIEEREIGSPARLQYRLNVSSISAVWDAWVVALDIRTQFQNLRGTHGILMSRGILNYEIKNQLENLRGAISRCYAIADTFFEECEQLRVTPLKIIQRFQQNLTKVAQTLATGLMSQRDIQVDPKGTYKDLPLGHTSRSERDIQVDPKGTLPPPSMPVTVTAPDPSKSTQKNTSNISQVSTHSGAENTHTKPESLKIFKPEEDKEVHQEIVEIVQLEVLLDTQQEPEDQEVKSQGKDCILMERSIPGGAGGENLEIQETPDWVQELEDKVRLGTTLPRSELVKLAEYSLGDYASVYRQSGRILDASPNDIKPEFLKFLQWYAFNRNPDISFVRATVNKAERSPEQWGVLLSWIETFQQVQDDPSVLETMLTEKVSSGGRNPNSLDLRLSNRLVLQNLFNKQDGES